MKLSAGLCASVIARAAAHGVADPASLPPKPHTPTSAPYVADPINFWPLPISVSYGGVLQPVSSGLTFTLSPAHGDLQAYADRLGAEIFATTSPSDEPSVGATANVNVVVANASAPLVQGVDESYTLAWPADGSDATLTAATVYGAMMGLQTLSQAVRYDFDAGCYSVAGAPLVVEDAPKFGWRGFLIDSDRHWLSVRAIHDIIDSMGYSKLNVLHWHIVDWQSWPLQSIAYPDLWTASWSKRERYTLADVASVVAYASVRGVRVVPEFDTPGHASSMCLGYPELCCSAACGGGGTVDGNYPLSPVPDASGKNVSLDAIQAVLGELAGVTVDEFFHLGGDEVDQTCWERTPSVQAWMADQGMGTDTDLVYAYFVEAVDAMTIKLDRSPVRWEEVWTHFGDALDPRTVVHAWLSKDALVDATAKGYRAIWSVDGLYYLDHLSEPWQTFYDVDILEGVSDAASRALVLGGETEMWGETADGSDVLQTIWPRAAAAAERQWSYDVVTTSSAPGVAERLGHHRCYLLERGVPAAPVTNLQARSAPSGPGSCASQ